MASALHPGEDVRPPPALSIREDVRSNERAMRQDGGQTNGRQEGQVRERMAG